jgi:hypothetical protein
VPPSQAPAHSICKQTPGIPVPLYSAVPFSATAAVPEGWLAGMAGAGIVAVRAADLRSPLHPNAADLYGRSRIPKYPAA